jgi:cytochrome c556
MGYRMGFSIKDFFKILVFGSLCAILAIGLFYSNAIAHKGASGIVKERMDYFDRNKDNLKAIQGYLKKEDFESITPLAMEIRDWAGKMHEYFPEGSGGSPSEASPDIWENFEGFRLAAQQNYQDADALYRASLNEDKANAVKAFKATAASCTSCHRNFRLD